MKLDTVERWECDLCGEIVTTTNAKTIPLKPLRITRDSQWIMNIELCSDCCPSFEPPSILKAIREFFKKLKKESRA